VTKAKQLERPVGLNHSAVSIRQQTAKSTLIGNDKTFF